MNIDLELTKKQKEFVDATEDEVLFGGAAGGGKSYAQLIDALLYALKYPKSKQLILRKTFPELEKSLIRSSRELYPQKICSYNTSTHSYSFINGSIIDFSYLQYEDTVYNFQSAEYDVIRFDELTHFTEFMYTYMLSRIRGTLPYPRSCKSSTNPGNIGHNWVKKRFPIDRPGETIQSENGTRRFIPSKVQDNIFLMENDKGYLQRLENLSENDKKMLLYGSWDVFEGQFFSEFDRNIHVIEPFNIPNEWQRYFVCDYGLDKLAGYWIAIDNEGLAYCYKEVWESGLIASQAAEKIKEYTNEDIYMYLAPPDLWNRRNDTGRSVAEIFSENGINLEKVSNDRTNGWLDMKEWLKPYDIPTDEGSKKISALRFFKTCTNAIESISQIGFDKKNPNDVANEPHILTHSADALRYFCAGRPVRAYKPKVKVSVLPLALQTETKTDNGGLLW